MSTALLPHHRRAPIAHALAILAPAGVFSLLMAALLHAWLPPVSAHMLTHVLTMGVIAPAVAVILARLEWSIAGPVMRSLLFAGSAQVMLLFLWHVPAAFSLAHETAIAAAAMHLSLLFAAVWFWLTIAVSDVHERPAAIIVLLATGKLFCLLGAFLAFAPWPFYAQVHAHMGAHMHDGAQALSDQHAAGLVMLLLCPLTYVGTCIALTLKALREEGEDALDFG